MKWWDKSLDKLNSEQWEALCDGCGLCCMHKFEDEDSGEILFTNVACRLLDCANSRCTDYVHRIEKVPDCMVIREFSAGQFEWLPETCAYRLRFENKPLPEWHPLISGDVESVHASGISMRGRCVPEGEVDESDIIDYIINPDSRG